MEVSRNLKKHSPLVAPLTPPPPVIIEQQLWYKKCRFYKHRWRLNISSKKGISKFELTGIHNNLDIFGQHFPDILIMNIFLQKKAKQVADKTQASTKFKQLGGWGFFCTGSLTQVKNIHPVCMIENKRNQWTKSLHFQNNTPEKLIDFLTMVDWIFQT